MPEAARAALELALSEALHRARNDLHAVTAMLQLQASTATVPAAREALLEAAARVRALSGLNARLDGLAQDVETTISSKNLLEGFAADLRTAHFAQRPVTLEVTAEQHPLAFHHSRPLGLILNELVLNAMKYAFPDDRAGEVLLLFRREGDEYLLTVCDDGVGLDPAAAPRGSGLGKRLVRALAAQIGGRVEAGLGQGGSGTSLTVSWPVE